MQYAPDLLTILKEHGWLTALVVILGFALLLALVYIAKLGLKKELALHGNIETLLGEIKGNTEETNKIIKKVTENPERSGDLLRRFDVLTAVRRVEQEVTRKCGQDTCPILPVVINELDEMHKELTSFAGEARTSREETQKMIREIHDRISSFITDLGKQMIIFMQKMVEWTAKKRKEHENGENH